MKQKKKLFEVALPLEAINKASACKSSDNLLMFCRNLPMSSSAEAVRNHPAFIRCAGTIIRNALELS